MRFSLPTLMGIVAYVGIACLAILHPTKMVAGVATALAIVLLIAATILAVYARPRGWRAFWIGFAIAAWVLEYASYEIQGLPQLTEMAKDQLFPYIEPNLPEVTEDGAVSPDYVRDLAVTYFEVIWHHALLAPLGIAVGLFARHLYARREQDKLQSEAGGVEIESTLNA